MAGWYYVVGESQHGPFEDDEIRRLLTEGKISDQTNVWRDGMDNWLPMSQVPEWSGQVVSTNPYSTNPYGAQGQSYHSPYPIRHNNGAAITSMICGICAVVVPFVICFFGAVASPFLGIAAVIFGHIGLNQISQSSVPMAGRGMAITGLVLGYIVIVALACMVLMGMLTGLSSI